MPGMTGLQLQAELKARRIETPVITLSARDDAPTRLMAGDLGARFFLRKPVDDQVLLETITWAIASQ